MAIVNSPSTYAGFPIGLEVAKCDVILEAHADVTAGDVVAISPSDITDDRFTKTQATASDNASIDDNEFGVFVVAMEDVASGARGRFAIQGVIDVSADGTAAIAVGNGVEADPSAANINVATTAGAKVVGYALEALGSGTGLIKVLFDGLNGFGTVHA